MRPHPHIQLASSVAGPAGPPDEPRSVGEVFERHAAYVAHVAHRMLGRDHEVEDVVQEVFAVVVRKLHQVHDWDGLRSWLASITVKCVHKTLSRRRVRRLFGLEAPFDYDSIAVADAGPEERCLVSQLNRQLDRLPPPQRIAWVLRYVEGESLEDVARITGCSLATAKRRIAAAQATVKEVMGHE